MPLPDRHMLLLRACSLVEQDEEQIAEMLVGATGEELAVDFMGMWAVASALTNLLSEMTGVPASEFLTRTRTRILNGMPPVTHEETGS